MALTTMPRHLKETLIAVLVPLMLLLLASVVMAETPTKARPKIPQANDEQYFVKVANRWTATNNQQTPAVLKGQISRQAKGYVLGPGDKFAVNIPDLNAYDHGYIETLVDAKGYATIPPFGTFKVSGLTLSMASDMFEEMAHYYLRSPKVFVTLKSMRPYTIYVTGSVDKPGTIEMGVQPKSSNSESGYQPRLSAVIAKAGGVLPTADLENIQVNNDATGRAQSVNLLKLIEQGDTSGDILLEPGDLVFIPHTDTPMPVYSKAMVSNLAKPTHTVQVFGWVETKNGGNAIELPPREMTLHNALAHASVMPQADLTHVIVLSYGKQHQSVDAKGEDIALNPGDTIIIPHRKRVYRLHHALSTVSAILFGAVNINGI